MKLYFGPRTRATRPRWLLEELELPYELVRLDAAQVAEHPALVDGEVTFHEPSALCLIHLADRHPERGFAPPPGTPERAQYLGWMSFVECRIEPHVMELHRYAQLPEERKAGRQEHLAQVRARLDAALEVVRSRVAERDHLVGEAFTAADLLMAAVLHLAHNLELLEAQPRLFEYVMVHAKRPACRKAVS